ncbi:hypothetical protein AURANDRAFT_72734 [Aureococcus anophagefferens]|uniref:Uncharacterized protein n=1 Tax=Aureococcus anophagefferens TaxID=44056 RepID=F0YNA9_AURAN|nr:hypothetical protein AURANDRAFT_72734 [Aureococcus anophagefferens]EGB03415.1 hypothetical protein AURANDRAFT_72734 [Aureococcus anophagefferens]|eukprot:XP_009041886.1 hypothetical protein AURANDRAFT_72734 [Aureococcus anophagefferens]
MGAYAWGWAEDGRCGIGKKLAIELKQTNFPAELCEFWDAHSHPQRCAAGQGHSLFLLPTGDLWACGIGTDEPRTVYHAKQCIVLIDQSRYAISSLGDLYAWGRGRYGALGHDDGEQSHTLPTRLQGLKANTVNRIACGRWHCVALMSNDQLLTWGRNHCGQIGIGSVSRACTRPVLIELEPGGGRSPSVMAYAWGDPEDSRLGGVDDSHEQTIIACGVSHNLILTTAGRLLAWGCGRYGQLGYGDLWDREEPVVVPTVRSNQSPLMTEAKGSSTLCSSSLASAKKHGTIFAWGFNSFGELGLGAWDEDIRLQPVSVRALSSSNTLDCAAGARHSLVLTHGKTLSGGMHKDACLDTNSRRELRLDTKRVQEDAQYFEALRNKIVISYSLPFEPELRYCLDTIPADQGGLIFARRFTYESVVTCLPCRQLLVCRACARRCHSNHMTKVKFSRWTVSQNRCGCADSGRCRVVYSSERGIFDSLVDRSNVQVTSSENKETISMQFFRELLKLLHPEGLSEDDIDSGEVALHSGHSPMSTSLVLGACPRKNAERQTQTTEVAGEHGKLAACAVVEGSGNKLGQPLLLSGVKHRIRGCSGSDVPVEASRVFRLPALPPPPPGACSGSLPPVVFWRVPARSGVPVDFRADLSSQLPVHGTLSARRETGNSDLGV